MYSLIKIIVHTIGIDKSIAYSSGSRIVGGIAGVLSVFFISTFLTGVEQGFYFTFGSLLSMQVFFELGLTGIMTQYVACEVSYLNLVNFEYEGNDRHISRLSSLVLFCFKWYLVLALGGFFLLMFAGYFFFTYYYKDEVNVDWLQPWILVCLGTAIKLFQSPFNSIFMGMGMVKDMSKIGFYQQLIIPLSSWIGLICGMKLYVLGVSYLLSVIIWQLYVNRIQLDKIIVNLLHRPITEKVTYFKEIFPYQWRIALSWISGYFMFQLFNPVLFAKEGAVVAGQMGMTLHALNAILAFSYSWMNTKVPLYSSLIAQKNYTQLDIIFNRTLKQEVYVCLLLLAIFASFLFIIDQTHFMIAGSPLSNRFLDNTPTLLLSIPVFTQQYINSWATYLRCHIKEPFLLYSVTAGVATCFTTFFLGNLFGLYGITISYCAISLFLFPWGYYIYKTKKAQWHM